MKFLISLFTVFCFTTQFAVAATTGLQNEDFKSATDLTNAGGTAAQLLNDTKIYLTGNGINDTLSNGIINGLIGGSSGGGVGVELLQNPGFESGVLNWISTGLTSSVVTSGANLIAGKKTASVVATASGQTFKSSAIAIQGLSGGNCAAQIYYLAAAANFTLSAFDGTNTLGSIALPISTNASQPQTITFPCGATAASTLQLIITSTAAGTGYFDNAHLGSLTLFQGLINGQPASVTTITSAGCVPAANCSGGNYLVPSGATSLQAIGIGGGGGGAGATTTAANNPGAGGNGGNTTFGTLIASGGNGAASSNPPAGGAFTVGTGWTDYGSFAGVSGITGNNTVASSLFFSGAPGPSSIFGGGAFAGYASGGGTAPTNSGCGGGGGGVGNNGNTHYSGASGSCGGVFNAITSTIPTTIAYSIGTAGTAGAAGTDGFAGGAGATGKIVIIAGFNAVAASAYLPSAGGLSAGDTVSGAWASCPAGTIAADGSAVSRTANVALFNAIGTTYGVGDGSTTFNVPSVPSIGAMTNLVSYGVNVITATTTNPTKSTTVGDVVRSEQIGDHAHIKGEFNQTGTGTQGSGSYLFALPNGLSFDPAKTTFFTGGPNGVPGTWGAQTGLGTASVNNGTVQGIGNVIPYDATHFRIGVVYIAAPSNGYDRGIMGSGFFGLSGPTIVNYDFDAPILTYGNSNLKTCIRTVAASPAPIMVNSVTSTDNSTGTTIINTSQTYTAAATIPNTIETAFANSTSAAFTLTLPDATLNKSKKFIIKKTDSSANIVTVATTASQTIGGITTYKMGTQYDQFTVQSDGANWQVLDFQIQTGVIAGLGTTATFPGATYIKMDTRAADPLNCYNTTTGLFVAFYPGLYRVSYVQYPTTGSGSVNAVIAGTGAGYMGTSLTNTVNAGGGLFRLTPGQSFGYQVQDGSVTMPGSNAQGFISSFTISRLGN